MVHIAELEDLAQFDARNVDPLLNWLTWTRGPRPYYNDFALGAGETGTGFSFVAEWYDPEPKLFFYELNGTSALMNDYVSAAGYTPEPATLFLLGAGGLAIMRRRRVKAAE